MRFTDVVSACIAFQNDNKSHELKKLFESIQIKNADEYIEVILYFFEKKLLTPDSLDSLLQSKVPRQISQGYQYLLEEGINPDLDWLLDSKHPYKKAYFVSLLCQVDLKIFITQLDEIELNKIKGVVGDYQSLLELLQQLQCASIENIKKVLTHPNPIFLTQVMQKKFKDDRLTIDDFNFLINAKLTELEAYNILYQAKIEWLLYQIFLKSESQEHELNVVDRAKALIILHAEGLATSTNLNLVQTYLLSAQRNQIVEENMHQMIAKTLVYLHRYPQLKPYYSYIFDTYPADVLCEHLLDLIEQDFWVEQEELPEFFNTWRINNIKTLEPYKYSQKYIKESVHAYHLLMRNKNIITENPLNLFAVKRPYELVEACIELGLNLTPNRIKLMQGCIFPLYWAKILNLYLKNNSLVNNELELSLSKNKHLDRVYEFLMILDRHQSFWVYKTAYFHNFDDIYLGCKILDSAGLSIKNFISKARDKLFELQTRVLCIKKMEEKKYLTENLVNLILNEQSPNIASLLLSILQIVPENITFILSEEFIRVLRNTQAKNYTSLIKVLEWLAVMNTVPSEFFEYIIKNPNLEVVKTACKLPHEQLIKFCADLQSNKEDALERAGINYLTFKYCERQVTVSHRIFKTFFKGINYLEKNHRLDFLSISLLSEIPKEHLSIAELILLRPELRSYQNELIELSLRSDLQTLLFSAKELHRNNIFDEEIFLKLIEKDSDYPSLVNLVIYLVQCGYYDTYKKYVLAHGAPREFVNILYKLPKLPSTIFKSLVSDEHYYQAISDLTTHFNFRMAYQIIDILHMLQGVEAPQMYVQIFKNLGVENFIFWEKLSASASAIQLIFRMSQNGLIVDTQLINFLLAATEPVREHLTATYIAIEQQNIQLTDEQLRMVLYSSKPEFFLKVCHLPTIINNPAYYNFALNYLAEDFILNLQYPELTIPALFMLTNKFPQEIGEDNFFQPAMDMLFILKNQQPTLEVAILLTANENFPAMTTLYSLLKRYCAPELITPWLIAEILTKAQNDAYLITPDAETNFWQKVSDLKSEEFIFRFVELLNYRTNISEFENPAISQAHLNTLSGYSGSFFRPLEVEEERPVKRAKLDNK